jgi:hypothetical protein
MKRLAIASAIFALPTLAAAHPSVVPHDHPHAVSMLPDLVALVLAALLVGFGIVALRYLRKD